MHGVIEPEARVVLRSEPRVVRIQITPTLRAGDVGDFRRQRKGFAYGRAHRCSPCQTRSWFAQFTVRVAPFRGDVNTFASVPCEYTAYSATVECRPQRRPLVGHPRRWG